MNCRRARHLLFDFFDGSGNEASRVEVDRHLGECAECEQFASEMSRSLALLRRVPMEPLDDTFNWKVRLAIHRERNEALSRARTANAWVRMWNVRYVMSGGLAFAAVLVAGTLLVRAPGVISPAQLPVATTQAEQESTRTSPVPRSNVAQNNGAPTDGHLVSTGAADENRGGAPQGAIDKTDAEARIDSLINAEAMRMSASERERYVQRRLENMQRLMKELQRQQPAAPAQR